MERGVLIERVRAGLEVARAEGRIGGRRFKLSPTQQKELAEMYQSGMSIRELQERFQIHAPSIYRYLKKSNIMLRKDSK